MKRSHLIIQRSLVPLGIFVISSLLSNPAKAQSQAAAASSSAAATSQSAAAQAQARAVAAYNAYNAAFLVQANGQTYYSNNLTTVDIGQNGEWTEALDIVVAEDRYQYTHAAADRNMVIALLNSLAYYNDGTNAPNGNWQTDGYDDNLAWMVNAYLRGYQLSGTSLFLTEAEQGWNQEYAQGWDTTVAGGGIWENTDKTAKCAVANNPFIFTGVGLYQATGDSTYLTKAEADYAWMRSHLLIATGQYAGQVHGCVNTAGAIEDPSPGDDDVYNSGAFLEAAAQLYRVTGNQTYYNDAVMVTNHIVNEGPVLHSTAEATGNQWAYWFTRGLSDFSTEASLWPQYKSWLLGNANAAWSERNKLNLTWNDWSGPTNDAEPPTDPMEMSSAAAIWQQFPPASVKLGGTYLIQSLASNLAVSVANASTAGNAAIIQSPYTRDTPEQQWTFEATSGGYYRIKNVNSGEVISVAGASGINGAAIVQRPAAAIIPGDDQWEAVLNPDGTYSFYNLNSLEALDVPGGSSTVGTQLDQWFGNNTNAQEFYLVRLSK